MAKQRINPRVLLARLVRSLRKTSPAAIAFSGGVDSSVLAAAALKASPGCVAFTVEDDSTPRRDMLDAQKTARELGMRHIVLPARRKPKEYYENNFDRCYHCKKHVFSLISRHAKKIGLKFVLDGTNKDDLNDFRPGMRAARELNVRFPLVEAGISKSGVRAIAKSLGLSVWDKPSSPCLSSRVPFGSKITREKLLRIGKAEDFLRKRFRLRVLRVRDHEGLARIQAGKSELKKLLGSKSSLLVAEKLKSFGFKRVCVDLDGYEKGG